ncbi:hypothetical protein ACIBJI_39920 [Nocardia sp. NPDC050408]|uniref:hypothetical protein n=1 Tax=Nocardia sp. NPDC050408 TaxID=3364319 RepID=UPI0037889B3F
MPNWTHKSQAWGSIGSAAIAFAALVLSIISLVLQSCSKSDVDAAREQEFASRVSWWIATAPDGKRVLMVQNRSIVPITKITFTGKITDPAYPPPLDSYLVVISPIPPCSIKTMTTVDPAMPLLNGTLRFRDPHGPWQIGPDGKLQDADPDTEMTVGKKEASTPGNDDPNPVEDAPDCGRG